MKYIKMLGLLAVAAAALMAFAGTVSAATLTSPANTKLGVGAELKGESSNTSLDGSVKIACSKSTVAGKISNAGGLDGEGKTQPVSGSIETLTFTECGSDTVSVLNKGSLSISSSGTVTSSGAEVTVQLHRVVFFIPVTTHCIYKTNNTAVGTVEESSSTGGTAKLNIGSSPIPEVETDGACGNDAVWTGSYTVTTPDFLDLD